MQNINKNKCRKIQVHVPSSGKMRGLIPFTQEICSFIRMNREKKQKCKLFLQMIKGYVLMLSLVRYKMLMVFKRTITGK